MRRERSNTPLQALTLLNDPAFFEAARALADRMIQEGGADPIRHGFRLCVARAPKPEESRVLIDLHRRSLARFTEEPILADQTAAKAGGEVKR